MFGKKKYDSKNIKINPIQYCASCGSGDIKIHLNHLEIDKCGNLSNISYYCKKCNIKINITGLR